MKKKYCTLFLICTIFCTSCFNYRDINRTIFVTAVVIDINEKDEIVVNVEAFNSFRSYQENVEQATRLIFHGTEVTMFKVLRQLNQASKYKLDYTQNKTLIFTERAAKHGIGDFIDFIQRDQEFLLRPFILVFMGTPEELLNMDIKQDEFIGLYLYELLQDRLLSSGLLHFRLNEFLNNRLMGKHINIINALEIDKEGIDEFLKIAGGAIFENDIMVDLMDSDKVVGFNFIMDNIQSGAVEIAHPQKESKYMSLEIRGSKTKREYKIEGGRIKLHMNVKTDVVVSEAHGGLEWERSELKKIATYGEQVITGMMEECFAMHKEMGLDIYNIQQDIERKFPDSDIDNAIVITDMIVDVQVHILGSPDVQGSN